MKKKTSVKKAKKSTRTKKVMHGIELAIQLLDAAAKEYVANEQAGREEIVAIGSDLKKHWKKISSL